MSCPGSQTYLFSDKKGRLAADIFITGDDFQGIYTYYNRERANDVHFDVWFCSHLQPLGSTSTLSS